MKTNIFGIVIVMTLTLLFSSLAEAKYFDILEFRELSSDFTADREFVQDMDQRVCAALRIESDSPVDVSLRERVYRTATIGGNKYLFFSISEPNLTLEAPGIEPKILTPPDHSEFITGKVYVLRYRTMDKIDLRINVDPRDADIIFDDRPWRPMRVQPGNYPVLISKAGYEPLEDVITVTQGNREFSYKLVSGGVEITIITNPSDADIYVNGEVWSGPTGNIAPGIYQLRITKPGYNDIAEDLIVSQQNRLFRYDLVAKTYQLTIDVRPEDAEVKVNGQIWFDRTGDLPPGEYHISISRAGFSSIDETIALMDNDMTLQYLLTGDSTPDSPATQPATMTGGLQSLTRYNFTFNMQSSSFVDGNVEFVFQVVNNDEEDRDLTVRLRGGTRFFDDQGREWGTLSSVLGNSTANAGQYNISNKMIRNVPTRLVIRAEGVHPSTNSVSLLEIDSNFGLIQFRDFPIRK